MGLFEILKLYILYSLFGSYTHSKPLFAWEKADLHLLEKACKSAGEVCGHHFLVSSYRLEAQKRFIKSKKGSRSWRTTTGLCGESPKRSPRPPAPLIQTMWIFELIGCSWCTFSNRQLLWRLQPQIVVQKLLNLAGVIKLPVCTFRKHVCVS